jgi:hypothetical protein
MQSPLRFPASRALSVCAGALAPLFVATPALAQMVDAGERGSLVFDDLSGFRVSSVGGIGYAGPIGVSVQSLNESTIGGANGDTTTNHYTNFWFAPSVDVFVINHLSVGGLIEVAVTSASMDTTLARLGTTTSTTLPTTTSVTLLPRVGWLFDVTKRFGIWPRLGLGWGEQQVAQPNGGGTNSFSAFLVDIDCGFLYRVTNDWFIRAAPEFTYGPGSHSVSNGNENTSASANLAAFSVAGGFGYMWNR